MCWYLMTPGFSRRVFLVPKKLAVKCSCWWSVYCRIPMKIAACYSRCEHLNRHCQVVKFASQTPLMWLLVNAKASFLPCFSHRIFSYCWSNMAVWLPPYIEHDADDFDEQRYQTVYNRMPGAVAAPTAGLHFDQDLLQRCQAKGVQLAYVTLHVCAGTFQPVRVEDLKEHVMHSEWYTVPTETVDAVRAAKASGGKVVAVGTTSMRALESASQSGQLEAGSDDTQLFITPGYVFKTVDRLITNFHLPKSTLMMLVSAFAGYDSIKAAYAHAIAQHYRFFSYGDAMLLTNTSDAQTDAGVTEK